MRSFQQLGRMDIRNPSSYVNSLALVAGVAERQALPDTANYLQIQSTSNVFIKFGDGTVTAAIPTDVTDGSGSELNGGIWYIGNADITHISVIAEYDCYVTLSYYSVK